MLGEPNTTKPKGHKPHELEQIVNSDKKEKLMQHHYKVAIIIKKGIVVIIAKSIFTHPLLCNTHELVCKEHMCMVVGIEQIGCQILY